MLQVRMRSRGKIDGRGTNEGWVGDWEGSHSISDRAISVVPCSLQSQCFSVSFFLAPSQAFLSHPYSVAYFPISLQPTLPKSKCVLDVSFSYPIFKVKPSPPFSFFFFFLLFFSSTKLPLSKKSHTSVYSCIRVIHIYFILFCAFYFLFQFRFLCFERVLLYGLRSRLI